MITPATPPSFAQLSVCMLQLRSTKVTRNNSASGERSSKREDVNSLSLLLRMVNPGLQRVWLNAHRAAEIVQDGLNPTAAALRDQTDDVLSARDGGISGASRVLREQR